MKAKGELRSSSLEAAQIFQKVLEGLTINNAKTLKIYIPDMFFVYGDSLIVYHTSKDGRVVRQSGMTPLKVLYPTILRMRKEYKSQL